MSKSRTKKVERIQPFCQPSPALGLVCVTASDACRYRAITRTRYLSLSRSQQEGELRRLYWDNLGRLHTTLGFCDRHDIRLYRMPSGLFPMSDESVGERMLRSMAANLSSVGRRAERLKIRVVNHPDQFVVLNSESPKVVINSRIILQKEALAMDLLGLQQTPWNMLLIHCGKSGRSQQLVEEIKSLPQSVRGRLCLENDELAYGAEETLRVCQAAGVPMVFDCHHHAIHDKLSDYEHPSLAHYTAAAEETWPDKSWQVVHVSNGATAFHDRAHSEMISSMPPAFARVPWIEVEARGKELAIAALRAEELV